MASPDPLSSGRAAFDAWYGARTEGAPATLGRRMNEALASEHADSTAERLLSAALACLDAALAKGGTRSAALDLLAADALLTLGCEAAAQQSQAASFATRVSACLADRLAA